VNYDGDAFEGLYLVQLTDDLDDQAPHRPLMHGSTRYNITKYHTLASMLFAYANNSIPCGPTPHDCTHPTFSTMFSVSREQPAFKGYTVPQPISRAVLCVLLTHDDTAPGGFRYLHLTDREPRSFTEVAGRPADVVVKVRSGVGPGCRIGRALDSREPDGFAGRGRGLV